MNDDKIAQMRTVKWIPAVDVSVGTAVGGGSLHVNGCLETDLSGSVGPGIDVKDGHVTPVKGFAVAVTAGVDLKGSGSDDIGETISGGGGFGATLSGSRGGGYFGLGFVTGAAASANKSLLHFNGFCK